MPALRLDLPSSLAHALVGTTRALVHVGGTYPVLRLHVARMAATGDVPPAAAAFNAFTIQPLVVPLQTSGLTRLTSRVPCS